MRDPGGSFQQIVLLPNFAASSALHSKRNSCFQEKTRLDETEELERVGQAECWIGVKDFQRWSRRLELVATRLLHFFPAWLPRALVPMVLNSNFVASRASHLTASPSCRFQYSERVSDREKPHAIGWIRGTNNCEETRQTPKITLKRGSKTRSREKKSRS